MILTLYSLTVARGIYLLHVCHLPAQSPDCANRVFCWVTRKLLLAWYRSKQRRGCSWNSRALAAKKNWEGTARREHAATLQSKTSTFAGQPWAGIGQLAIPCKYSLRDAPKHAWSQRRGAAACCRRIALPPPIVYFYYIPPCCRKLDFNWGFYNRWVTIVRTRVCTIYV